MNHGAVEVVRRVEPAMPPQARWIPAAPAASGGSLDRVLSIRHAGRRWICREPFSSLLRRLPDELWADPQARGWECVKRNARREVWRAELAGQTFYLKYYRCRTSDRIKELLRGAACRIEWNGGLYALRHGIPAVRPVACTGHVAYRGGASLLITEGVEHVRGLNEFWRLLKADDDPHRRRDDTLQLIERLADMIARAHQAGFEHLDMHAANILVQTIGPRRYRTLLVDLQCARLDVPVHDDAIVRNLAQLNQWFRKEATIGDRLRFLRAYLRWRNEYEGAFEHSRRIGLSFEKLVAALDRAAARHAERLWAARDRRAARDGRYVARVRLPGGWRGMAYLRCKHPIAGSPVSLRSFRREDWRRMLPRVLDVLARKRADCKDSHSALVGTCVIEHPDGPVPAIIKQPRPRNFARQLRHLLSPSRARRAWLTAFALLNRDIPTARPLAYLEKRRGPFVLKSVIVTERICDAQGLDAWLRAHARALRRGPGFARRRELTERVACFVRRLVERGFYHRDCKAANILITEPRGELLWVDMDGIRHVGRLSEAQRLAPLVRLHVSLLDVPGLTRTDRVRFLKRFLARFGSDPDEWRRVWRAAEPLVAQKLLAVRQRRQWKLRNYGRI